MYIDFSKLFHRTSKDTSDGGTVHIPDDMSVWPESWKTVIYKVYELLPTLALKKVAPKHDPGLFNTISNRTSARTFVSTPITKSELSTLLLYSCGEISSDKSASHRAQPSGGPQYPVEAYVLVFRGTDELPAGAYHYNVRDHAIETLCAGKFTKDDIKKLFVYDWVQNAAASIVLTGIFSRTKIKYGQRGYRYALLEAGHIGQNLYLVSNALGMQCCGMGGSRDVELEELLGIDGEHESVLYALVLGK